MRYAEKRNNYCCFFKSKNFDPKGELDSVIYRSHMVGQKICGLLLKLSDRSVEEGMPSCSLIKSLISPFNQTHNEY